MKPLCRIIAGRAGGLPIQVLNSLRCWPRVPGGLRPRFIRRLEPMSPVRRLSDATGPGATSGFTFADESSVAPPIFLAGLAKSTNGFYILRLHASAATALGRRKLILIADNEAACAALPKGTARIDFAFSLLCSSWSTATHCDLSTRSVLGQHYGRSVQVQGAPASMLG